MQLKFHDSFKAQMPLLEQEVLIYICSKTLSCPIAFSHGWKGEKERVGPRSVGGGGEVRIGSGSGLRLTLTLLPWGALPWISPRPLQEVLKENLEGKGGP